jgi:tellurite resistance protein
MANHTINPDTKALEDAFFARESERLLRELRAKAEREQERAALKEAIRGADDALIDHLLDLGVNSRTVLALGIVPLAAVAWADGRLDPREREAILRAAQERGVIQGAAGHEMLETWLKDRPGPTLVDAWKKYVSGLWAQLDGTEKRELAEEILGSARSVAEAAGGFLGLGKKVSEAEAAVLDELAAFLK